MRVFGGLDELRAAVGTTIGTSDWLSVQRSRIELFADATDDHDWLPPEADRAEGGPFSEGVAHGFLTLSLLPVLVGQVYRVDGIRSGVNYGLNRVRFTAPVPVGANIRAAVDLDDVTEVGPGGAAVQLWTTVRVELDGSERPALVAEWITRLYR